MSSMDLARLASLVVSNPTLQGVHLNHLLLFFAVASSIKDDHLLIQPSEHDLTVAPGGSGIRGYWIATAAWTRLKWGQCQR